MTAVHELTLLIYRITDEFPDAELRAHLRRAAMKVAAGQREAAVELHSLIELAGELRHIGPRVCSALHTALSALDARRSTLDSRPASPRSNP
jgi:hypothetical protein